MHIWMYSCGGILNKSMDLSMISYIKKKNPLLTFVASCYESSQYYYEEFVERFSSYGFRHFELLHLDHNVKKKSLERVLKSDLIYLSGGNTFYFLSSIQKTSFHKLLWTFVRSGGILAGNSAGSIIMTPDIMTASYPEDDRDENEVGLDDLTALALVNFEFFPHYDDTSPYIKALTSNSIKSPYVIYAVTDGSGICINGPSIAFFGEVWGFYNGEKFQVCGL